MDSNNSTLNNLLTVPKKTLSFTQCSLFSIPQWLRLSSSRCSGVVDDSGRLVMKQVDSIEVLPVLLIVRCLVMRPTCISPGHLIRQCAVEITSNLRSSIRPWPTSSVFVILRFFIRCIKRVLNGCTHRFMIVFKSKHIITPLVLNGSTDILLGKDCIAGDDGAFKFTML